MEKIPSFEGMTRFNDLNAFETTSNIAIFYFNGKIISVLA
jgi:hypothetical protein